MIEDFTTDKEGYGCYKGYRIGMIEKLPEKFYSFERMIQEKIQELIDKVTALEEAVKQCDRPVDLEVKLNHPDNCIDCGSTALFRGLVLNDPEKEGKYRLLGIHDILL